MENPIVNTTYGAIAGVEEEHCFHWFGIPYAKAPVRELRFKRAVPHPGWKSLRVCDKMGPKPIQMAGGKFAQLTASDTPESEDCLSLNVWAPKDAQNRPVFVWIYGGGAHTGEASAPEYNLGKFASEDMVAVSFNYRLGVLGFYDFSQYSPEFDSNCGISDMLLALKWVHDNIAAFGGNPDRVTIAGESAGATAVMALMAAPEGRKYFHQAIMMSGIASNITGACTQTINRDRFLKKLNMTMEQIGQLKDMSIADLKVGCSQFFEGEKHAHPGIMVSGPVIDDLVPKTFIQAILDGDTKEIACLFGTCKNEGGLFQYMNLCPETWEEIEQMLTINGYADRIPQFHDVYDKLEPKKVIAEINKDRMFWADTMKCALAQSAYQKTYLYRFEFATPISKVLKLGATHTMDICPALDTYEGNMATLYKGVFKRSLRKLHGAMHDAFTSFVKTGSPQWMPFDKEDYTTMVFGRKNHQEQKQFDLVRYTLWQDISLYL